MLTHQDCQAIEQRHGSPFYLLDRAEFIANYQTFLGSFEARYPRVRIGYSYKTNYIPYLCKLVKDLGGHAEVVSRLELDLALAVGQDPTKIIFNGPVKGDDDIALALAGGGIVNLDSWPEVEGALKFARAHPDRTPRLGLRIRCDLTDPTGRSHVQEGLRMSRFGFPADALDSVGARLRAAGLTVRALHGHTSSSSRSCWIYERITRTLCELAERFFPDTIEEINVGGGFYGNMPVGFGPAERPSFDAYAAAIVGTLQDSAWAQKRTPILTLEPGVALAASAMSFVTRVIEVKTLDGMRLAVVDGSIFHTKPSGHTRPQPFQILRPEGSSGAAGPLRVTGATCMEKDILLDNIVEALAPGDYVRIDNVGAYTVVMSPTFIHPAPAIVAREADGFLAVRTKQTFAEAFASYRF